MNILIFGGIATAIVITLYILERIFPDLFKRLPDNNGYDTIFPTQDEPSEEDT